ncbi:biliverdin-producing heme oxygenase [Rhizobium rhizoryzae]|uniref:Heme oxygenase n=2 Tax=Rhizobium/Agrobacterium group TaxID=227290 RepID=A0A7W6LF93_9HYPH|nr:biliverdin-producing heme oxygenase [Rhizobium rhizoryzae]MBB4142192.1 heme oxygenase [Rhizobium rhizoryzae]
MGNVNSALQYMPPSSRRFLLRERTSDRHAAVDAAVGSFRTLVHYKAYLQGLHAFRRPLDDQMLSCRFPVEFGTWRPQAISPLIVADMNDLALAPKKPADPISLTADLESLLGTLYVLEGSTLGARVLYRRANELGLSGTHGARHLQGQAASDGFSRFLQILDAAPDVDMNKVIGASDLAFQWAETAFKDNVNE